jgi:hypothetical protein
MERQTRPKEPSRVVRLLCAMGAGLAAYYVFAFDWTKNPALVVFLASYGGWLGLAAVGRTVRGGAWQFLSNTLVIVGTIAFVVAMVQR